MMTLRQLVSQTSDVTGSRHESRWLCEVATSLDADEFDAALDEPVTERMIAHLDAMVARYRTGEPIQYVLGRWGFRHLDLAIDRRVLIPRPETELVAGAAIELASQMGSGTKRHMARHVADLGTGSGAIGLSVASELPIDGITVWITDISAEALAVARGNLAGIGPAAPNVRVGHGSWFEALPDGVGFDVIVSNPPYVADASPDLDGSVSEWEPAGALFSGPDGLDAIRVIVAGAPSHLSPDGWLVLEIGADQGAAVAELFAAEGFTDVEIRPDLAGHDRIAVGRASA